MKVIGIALNNKIAFLRHFRSEYEQAQHFLYQSFTIYFNSEAREAFAKDVKELQEKYLKLHDEYQQIKQSEPRFFGKKQWEQEKNQSYQRAMQAQKAYLELENKQRFYTPSLHIEDKYTEIALNELNKNNPELVAKAERCYEICEKYETILAEVKAKIPNFELDNPNQKTNLSQKQEREQETNKNKGR